MPFGTQVSNEFTFVVEEHVCRCECRRFLAVIESCCRSVFFTDHHETAATDISGGGKSNGKSKLCCDGCVDGVAPFLQNVGSDPGSQRVCGHNHGRVCN